LRECTQHDDVTEVEAAITQEAMTCRKYGWSAGGSTQLFYASKDAVEQSHPQQQQHMRDAAVGDDATGDVEQQLRQKR